MVLGILVLVVCGIILTLVLIDLVKEVRDEHQETNHPIR